MRNSKIKENEIYGRLTVKKLAGLNRHKKRIWECLCDCGKTTKVISQKLTSGHTRSCGCLVRDVSRENRIKEAKHFNTSGGVATRTYSTWKSMKRRCNIEDDKDYPNYGGRGIKICKEWEKDFCCFLRDMGERPKGFTIGRIDNDEGYSKDNCRWENSCQQSVNKRTTKLTDKQCKDIICDNRAQSKISAEYGVSQTHISKIKRGLSRNGY